jgi:proton-coupled amino acid transporter
MSLPLPHDGAFSIGPLPVPLSTSPGPNRGRGSPSSAPRAVSIARLAASPIRSHAGSPPVRQIPTPNQPFSSGSYASSVTPLAGPAVSSQPGPGISALAAALSASGTQSPPKLGTPPLRTESPPTTNSQALASGVQSNYGSFDTKVRSVQGAPGWNGPNGYEDPEIVKRHLVQPSETTA